GRGYLLYLDLKHVDAAGPSIVLSYVVSGVPESQLGDPPLPVGAERLLPFIEAFLVLSYFRSRIGKQHEQLLAGPLRVTVRRPYVLADSYNQLRMRSI
nr:E3 ubiquitin-protein ligase UPL1-like isoform X1 [Tanacetum cinerariifolium]